MKAQRIAITALLLGASAIAWGASPNDKSTQRTFRWVDAKGVIHYSDTIPPEFSRNETSELNPQGVAVQKHPAQLSPTEMKSADARAAEVDRLKKHDQFLLTTYTSTREIEQLRDERLGLIDGQIVAAKGFLTAAQSRMGALEARAKNYRPYAGENARRMPDQLAEEMVRTLNEERAQRAVLAQKASEKDEMRARFQDDIDRFRQLVAQRASAAR
ncbi:DUF4124 domain-containing protein [bacterium]|nr:MAG: DUF4124 domain-containing protein [bacterium]